MSWQSQALALLSTSLIRPLGLAAAAWLILRVLRVRHPATRHAVWTAVLIAMPVLPAVSLIAPHWKLPVLPGGGSFTAPRRSPAPIFQLPELPSPSATPSAPASVTGSRESAPPTRFNAAAAILWCYFAGVLAMAVYRAIGWALLRRVLARSGPLRHGLLRESADVATPVAVGLLHPSVILPAGWRSWSAATRRAVLAHEFAHLRRHDELVAALCRLSQCLFWFHPLAWWLARTISDLAELACDAAALEKSESPAQYARVLLHFAGAVNRTGHRAILPGLAMAAHPAMGRRIDQVFELAAGALPKPARRASLLALLGLPAACLAATVGLAPLRAPVAFFPYAQSAPERAFEVAAVKPAADPGRVPMFCIIPCDPGERLSVENGRVDIRYMSLRNLIVSAYGIKSYQLSGPEWMRTERFDIAAKMPAGATREQLPEMLQALLAERFKLAIHRETKDTPVFALVVGKGGPKLDPPAADADAPLAAAAGGESLYTGQGDAHVDGNGRISVSGASYGPLRTEGIRNGRHEFDFLKVTMAGLVELLTPHVDRPLIDMTDLKGSYHLKVVLEMPPPPPGEEGGRRDSVAPGGRPPVDFVAEGFMKAVEKSGLKVEKRTAPVTGIVVDRLEKTPTAN